MRGIEREEGSKRYERKGEKQREGEGGDREGGREKIKERERGG